MKGGEVFLLFVLFFCWNLLVFGGFVMVLMVNLENGVKEIGKFMDEVMWMRV